jgi:phosphate transport system permease protein
MKPSTARRKAVSALFVGFCGLSVVVALIPLAFILFFVLSQGLRAVNLAFFVNMPAPVGEVGGGMANAIVGTLMVSGLASSMAVPIGLVSGIYMSEYAGSRFASLVRFAADTLNGVPSIVIGVFAYGVAVLPFKAFSAVAGGFALGIMMIPIIARTAEELLLLVPGSMREGALALGATRARVLGHVDPAQDANRHGQQRPQTREHQRPDNRVRHPAARFADGLRHVGEEIDVDRRHALAHHVEQHERQRHERDQDR